VLRYVARVCCDAGAPLYGRGPSQATQADFFIDLCALLGNKDTLAKYAGLIIINEQTNHSRGRRQPHQGQRGGQSSFFQQPARADPQSALFAFGTFPRLLPLAPGLLLPPPSSHSPDEELLWFSDFYL